MKSIRRLVRIADLAFTENQFPLRRTIGVFPFSPQVRPLTWSERMATSPPSFPAFARIVGQTSSCRRHMASGSCSAARLSGRWKNRPHWKNRAHRPRGCMTSASRPPTCASPQMSTVFSDAPNTAAAGPSVPTATGAARPPPDH
ncbi:hypothetical protein ACFYUJ_37525 [Streptomyces sp. NPDC004520]|uniref:hypothetical protein n=1 Tax=Streptomyces sp. NPDC004520 TaxID=3364702 RepID=UPI0036D0F8D4